MQTHWDTVIIGAGAAGLATAIFARQKSATRTVLLLEGARKPGAKILVSGGARCNVTNAVVTERDYWGGSPGFIRRVLKGLTVEQTIEFFERAGVALHEERDGKLFPDSNSARDVLNALLRQVAATGAALRAGDRVTAVRRAESGFVVSTPTAEFTASRVVLATGGQSLPKSGSDGAGYRFARALGHTMVPTTPALAPLVLDGIADGAVHTALSGVALDARLTLWTNGAAAAHLRGPLLWTHFGISGPAVLNMSRHLLRARLEGRRERLTASFVPELDFQGMEGIWLEEMRQRPRSTLASALARLLPGSMAAAILARAGLHDSNPLSRLPRDQRRALTHALTSWPLPVVDSRGYNYAEATAGGVAVPEVDPSTMESRVCPGLYLVGEVLDVDGRLGGFNFQWAWSSAALAGAALGR